MPNEFGNIAGELDFNDKTFPLVKKEGSLGELTPLNPVSAKKIKEVIVRCGIDILLPSTLGRPSGLIPSGVPHTEYRLNYDSQLTGRFRERISDLRRQGLLDGTDYMWTLRINNSLITPDTMKTLGITQNNLVIPEPASRLARFWRNIADQKKPSINGRVTITNETIYKDLDPLKLITAEHFTPRDIYLTGKLVDFVNETGNEGSTPRDVAIAHLLESVVFSARRDPVEKRAEYAKAMEEIRTKSINPSQDARDAEIFRKLLSELLQIPAEE